MESKMCKDCPLWPYWPLDRIEGMGLYCIVQCRNVRISSHWCDFAKTWLTKTREERGKENRKSMAIAELTILILDQMEADGRFPESMPEDKKEECRMREGMLISRGLAQKTIEELEQSLQKRKALIQK